ncbi:hypothetical protein [uncultured Lamprocystis sp.]|jgi:hypothetical protein|uniref:hypothetical protein n=1 Tax=uncultured Lamprocystis sp. TaxID=543132 RepID=UPI0025FEFE29|nr:hypothetical protein [uncultured Lamprocystis sp.]
MNTDAPASTPNPGTLPPPPSLKLTVKQLAAYQPGLTLGGVRWALFHAENNGLAKTGAVSRMGRRILIDPVKFCAWIDSNPTMSPPRPKVGRKVSKTHPPEKRRPSPMAA